MGGFPVWPKKEDLEKWVNDHMLPAFPAELRTQVERVNYPGKRISLVVVVMKSVGTPKENRQLMFKTIKAFNAGKTLIPSSRRRAHFMGGSIEAPAPTGRRQLG